MGCSTALVLVPVAKLQVQLFPSTNRKMRATSQKPRFGGWNSYRRAFHHAEQWQQFVHHLQNTAVFKQPQKTGGVPVTSTAPLHLVL